LGGGAAIVQAAAPVNPVVPLTHTVHYECRTLHRNELAPDTLAQAVEDEFYAQGDYHRVYFGEIVAVYADEDAAARL